MCSVCGVDTLCGIEGQHNNQVHSAQDLWSREAESWMDGWMMDVR